MTSSTGTVDWYIDIVHASSLMNIGCSATKSYRWRVKKSSTRVSLRKQVKHRKGFQKLIAIRKRTNMAVFLSCNIGPKQFHFVSYLLWTESISNFSYFCCQASICCLFEDFHCKLTSVNYAPSPILQFGRLHLFSCESW